MGFGGEEIIDAYLANLDERENEEAARLSDVEENHEHWLNHTEAMWNIRSSLLKGQEISAILLDPVGFMFPKDWYAYKLRYQPGVGLVKGSPNPLYLGRRTA